MSKDLTKEYKEAVMNDLPDLWDRIEAAVDALEEEKSTVTATNVTAETNEKSNAEAKVTDFKQAEATVKKKKSKRIPAWVFVSIPSAAILMIAIVPLFLWMASGGGSKSATMCDTATPTAAANAEVAEFSDAAASMDSDSFENTIAAAGEEDNKKSSYDFKDEAETVDATAPATAEESEPDKFDGDGQSLDISPRVYVCINSYDAESKTAQVVIKGVESGELAPGSDNSFTLANPHKDNNFKVSQIVIDGEEIKVRVADDEELIAGEEYLVVLTPVEDEDGIVWEIRRY